jgi:hypothetical protein
VEPRALGVDLRLEAAIPGDDHVPVLVHLMDNAPVTGPQPGLVGDVLHELDSHPDGDAGPDPGREQLCTMGVHGALIGFAAARLDPRPGVDGAGDNRPSTKWAPPAGRIRIRRLRIVSPAASPSEHPLITPAHEPNDTQKEPSERRSALHRLLRRGPGLEERLARIVDAHRRDLAEQRARFERTLEDLERRERLLSDAKASVERLLRLGARDLDAREADVARLISEVTEREERLREEEEELARRRSETGAVELRRVLIDQREQALEQREQALEHRDQSLAATEATLAEKERALAEREWTLAMQEEAATAPSDSGEPQEAQAPSVAFFAGPTYRFVELADAPISGRTLVVKGEPFEILRIGPSPLPGDTRRCAYLLRRPGDDAS